MGKTQPVKIEKRNFFKDQKIKKKEKKKKRKERNISNALIQNPQAKHLEEGGMWRAALHLHPFRPQLHCPRPLPRQKSQGYKLYAQIGPTNNKLCVS